MDVPAAALNAFLNQLTLFEPGLVRHIRWMVTAPSMVSAKGANFGIEARYQILDAEHQIGALFLFFYTQPSRHFVAWAPKRLIQRQSPAQYLWKKLSSWQKNLVRNEVRCCANARGISYNFWLVFSEIVTTESRVWLSLSQNPELYYDDDPDDYARGSPARRQRSMEAGLVTSFGRLGGVDYRLPTQTGLALTFYPILNLEE